MSEQHRSHTAAMITLGCKVNQYESEAIAERLAELGFRVLSPTDFCDVYIVNTCTVTAESDRKCRQLIRRAIAKNPEAYIIVCGCMAQVSPDACAAIEGVDCILGNSDKLRCADEALRLVTDGHKRGSASVCVDDVDSAPFEPMCIHQFGRTRAYLKIEDGCESRCTYCIIPKARGKVRSKPFDEVIAEARALIESGTREIVLTGIETGSYGRDTGEHDLADVLQAVNAIEGDFRIRTGSLDPFAMKRVFVDRIAGLSKLAPHFHLSMQSGSDRILALMKRKYNAEIALNNILYLKKAMPSVMLTTDIITGFPTETEDDFAATVEFARKARFLSMHVFPYSERKGTPAAQMEGSVPVSIRHARCNALIEVGKSITEELLDDFLARNRTVPVLFEVYKDGMAIGHTPEFVEIGVRSPRDLRSEIRTVTLAGRSGALCLGELTEFNQ